MAYEVAWARAASIPRGRAVFGRVGRLIQSMSGLLVWVMDQ
jgi:hypothetical protein